MQEAKTAIKRSADPRVYAANVRLSVSQQDYTLDAAKYAQCSTLADLPWDTLDRPTGGMPCLAAHDGVKHEGISADVVDAWFPTAPGQPDLKKDIDAIYARVGNEAADGRKRQRLA